MFSLHAKYGFFYVNIYIVYSWIERQRLSRQKNNLPVTQKGYDTFETTVGKLSARRIQIFRDYFCSGVILKVIQHNFQKQCLNKIRPRRSEFSLPRAFQRWSQKFLNPSDSLANYIFVGSYWTSNPDVLGGRGMQANRKGRKEEVGGRLG